jgi:hypothetical protein
MPYFRFQINVIGVATVTEEAETLEEARELAIEAFKDIREQAKLEEHMCDTEYFKLDLDTISLYKEQD